MSERLPIVDRLIFLLFLIFIAIPFITPVKLPLPISPSTRKVYEIVTGLKPGDAVLWVTDFTLAGWAEVAPGEIAILNLILDQSREKGVKLIIATTYTGESMAVVKRIYEKHLDFSGLKYGEDYVFLGWVPGYESALAGMASDLPATVKADYFGTPISEIPMMRDLRRKEDFALFGFSSSTSPDPYPRQWGGIPIVANILVATVGWLMPYVEKGIVTTYIAGIRGGAELEYLMGKPGMAMGLITAQSLAHFYGVALVIVANIYYFGFVRRERR